ncbi:MAG TPA: glutathione S-transferase N-terminal domain-containing protein [Gammaproteobacteria bacterium]|nr:glutathione S-transferase N-terminal domain-containing protein [Gammaproteobacteria bacterium]
MILYSHPDDPAGHAMRLILAEKGVAAKLVEVSGQAPPDDLLSLSPYGNMPTLVTREVTLYDPRVIAEYLDDRYPHPPLMATEPALRARIRLFIGEVGGEWYGQCRQIAKGTSREKTAARHALGETLIANDEVFAVAPYLLSESYGLADCIVAPVLWRLPALGIPLPREARALRGYMQRVFRRPSFVVSLTGSERAMATAV